MLVGAYKPRQKTAFAVEGGKVIVAAKDAEAAQSSTPPRMVSSPALKIPQGLIWIGARTQRKALRRGSLRFHLQPVTATVPRGGTAALRRRPLSARARMAVVGEP